MSQSAYCNPAGIYATIRYVDSRIDALTFSGVSSEYVDNAIAGSAALHVKKAGDTMTGQLKQADGTRHAPSYTFESHPNTGMYCDTNGALNLSHMAADVLRLGTNHAQIVPAGAFLLLGSDTVIRRDGAGIACLRNAANPHTFRVYRQYDLPTYERISITFDGYATIKSEAAGSGTQYPIRLKSNTIRAHCYGFEVSDGEGEGESYVYASRCSTTGNTPTELFLDGSSTRIAVPEDTSLVFTCLVIGRSTLSSACCGWELKGVIRNGATMEVVGMVSKMALTAKPDPSWDVTVDADDPNSALRIKATGQIGVTIKWFARTTVARVSGVD